MTLEAPCDQSVILANGTVVVHRKMSVVVFDVRGVGTMRYMYTTADPNGVVSQAVAKIATMAYNEENGIAA